MADEQIISINFEELEYEHLLDYKALYQYIKERLHPDKMTYILIKQLKTQGPTYDITPPLETMDGVFVCKVRHGLAHLWTFWGC